MDDLDKSHRVKDPKGIESERSDSGSKAPAEAVAAEGAEFSSAQNPDEPGGDQGPVPEKLSLLATRHLEIPAYGLTLAREVLDREERDLIANAKRLGIFHDDVTSLIQDADNIDSGGTEHDVFLFTNSETAYVIKRTKDDAYGHPQEKATPAQYLQRLDHFNIVFPELAMLVIGVSLNERGFGVIWTKQPYVKGEALDDPEELIDIVKGCGWIKGVGNSYQHEKTGVMISDANIGNILIDANGHPQFFDVVVEELGLFGD